MRSDFRTNGVEDDISRITATSVEDVLKREMCQERGSLGKTSLASGSSKVKGDEFAKSCVGLLRIMGCA